MKRIRRLCGANKSSILPPRTTTQDGRRHFARDFGGTSNASSNFRHNGAAMLKMPTRISWWLRVQHDVAVWKQLHPTNGTCKRQEDRRAAWPEQVRTLRRIVQNHEAVCVVAAKDGHHHSNLFSRCGWREERHSLLLCEPFIELGIFQNLNHGCIERPAC